MSYLNEVITSLSLAGDNLFTKKCNDWLTSHTGTQKALLTPSCTSALELAALLIGIEPGDEVIMPSFTFTSTANAFALRGARIAFIDIRPDTMNIDERLLEAAINERTKAIVPVHYAGVSCEMDTILAVSQAHNLAVVEDAAQGLMSKYKGRALGTLGRLGCLSFHDTKNYTSGEGGAILVNHQPYISRAEIIREKGTNRTQFFRGQVDKYSWVDIGSSYLPSDLSAALLFSQLEIADKIYNDRMITWDFYAKNLAELAKSEDLVLPTIPEGCTHNAHIFFIRVRTANIREKLLLHLKERGIGAAFHYIPLHSSIAGKKYGYFVGEDKYTTSESDKLVRLPIYSDLTEDERTYVVDAVREFFKN